MSVLNAVCVGSVECVYQWYTPTQYMVMCFRLFTGAMSALSDLYPQVWCHPSHTLWGAVL